MAQNAKGFDIMKQINAFIFVMATIATVLATFLAWFLLYMR